MTISEKNKLDILIYNICSDNFSEQCQIEKLKLIANEYNITVDKLCKRYEWLKNMEINPNQIYLEENHHQIYKIFDEYNKMLNENDIEYY